MVCALNFQITESLTSYAIVTFLVYGHKLNMKEVVWHASVHTALQRYCVD